MSPAGDGTNAATLAGGVFRRHQTKIGHEVGRREAWRVVKGGGDPGGRDHIHTAQRAQVSHQWEQRGGDLRT